MDWPSRHLDAPYRLTTAAGLDSITVQGLLGTWSVKTRITEAVLTRLVRTALFSGG